MSRQDRACWVRAALPLLWVSGCLSLNCSSHVMGPVGGSLSVRCQYKEKFKGNKKYWCQRPCSALWRNKVVQTTESEREVRRGRVSISDNPATLTFTVTLEDLTEEDKGTYWCGIDVSLFQGVDHTFPVMVSVSPAPPESAPTSTPAPTPSPPTSTTPAQTSAAAAKTPAVSIAPTPANSTHRQSTLDESQLSPDQGLPVLLAFLGLLLLLLVGASLLAWRMIRRRIKAAEKPEPLQNPSENEPCYVNLEMQGQSLLEEPVPPRQAEAQYSTVQAPREDPQYSTVVFNLPNQDAEDNETPLQGPPQPEPEYSVIKKK